MKKLILDVDTGVDDAQTIMMALAAPDVEILGITCSHGNTPLENVLKNVLPSAHYMKDTEEAHFMEKISSHTRKMVQTDRYQKELVSGPGFNTCDTYALAAAIDDALITESGSVSGVGGDLHLRHDGRRSHGSAEEDKALIMKRTDVEKFKQLLMKALQ